MKGLLLRVGIDKGTGGCLGPIFSDGSFEYIPIPERCATSERRTYKHLIGRSGRPLSDFVPPRVYNSIPHVDPEFETFTYGDPTRNKRGQLARLSRDDLLIFYAGLEPREGSGKSRLYVIGYFTVQHVYDFNKILDKERVSILDSLPNNAHSKRTYFDDGLVIIKGDPDNSELLSHGVLLGDVNDKLLKALKSIFGFSVSLRRAIGHWVKEPYTQKVRSWLNKQKS